jgi:hypothetical protein
MADEWQMNGRMAEVSTYVLFMVHADDDDNDTLIFYITDIFGPAAKDKLSPTSICFLVHK